MRYTSYIRSVNSKNINLLLTYLPEIVNLETSPVFADILKPEIPYNTL